MIVAEIERHLATIQASTKRAIEALSALTEPHAQTLAGSPSPGAHAAKRLDIMSIEPKLVGAEAFATVSPGNNRKLDKD